MDEIKSPVAFKEFRDERTRMPEDVLSLIREYRKANPLNPRTGAPWESYAELIRFSYGSAVKSNGFDTSLLKAICSLPSVQGDLKTPMGRRKGSTSRKGGADA